MFLLHYQILKQQMTRNYQVGQLWADLLPITNILISNNKY